MSRFLEYISHHPLLAAITLIVAAIAVAFELWQRSRGSSGLSNNEAIALQNKGALLLDVRSADEYAGGHIVDARHIEVSQLSANIDTIKKYREKPVIVYCESGARSAAAVKTLKDNGFAQVFNLSGGLAQWRQDNLPLNRATKAAGKK
jgi:rhodanese-related sulfurtransferase